MRKNIAILGSTGSIGTQTLEVIKYHNRLFNVEILTAKSNVTLLIEQALEFNPSVVIIADQNKYKTLKEALSGSEIEVQSGINAIAEIVKKNNIDMVLTAMVGYAGLLPTINAIKSGKDIALANKETMVVAGELIQSLVHKHNVNIYPVDSEHSAIYQCLVGEEHTTIEKIYLTASGGPFRNKSLNELYEVTLEEALNHPNWNMGNKITIDSATLMNKGLEAIEAKWLFNLDAEQIDVIIHPQSIIHSLVQFKDSSIKAQMGLPDMRLPIQYALGFPERLESGFQRFDFADYPVLHFERPDLIRFKNLKIALEALRKGGNLPCIMNAANEIAVDAFLKEKIGFMQMPGLIEKTINKLSFQQNLCYDDYVETNKEARKLTESFI